MAKPKRKKNPVVRMRQSAVRSMQSDIIDAAYKMFMAVALTTVLDKHDAQPWLNERATERN